jgi:hypothetical protein
MIAPMADPIPYIRLFVGALAADTQHLTAGQLGNQVGRVA